MMLKSESERMITSDMMYVSSNSEHLFVILWKQNYKKTVSIEFQNLHTEINDFIKSVIIGVKG